MSSPYFLCIPGEFVVIGKEPDGDSVRFKADNPDLFKRLHNAHRILQKISRDGTVQLRFEAIDAPELHYGSAAQPLGKEARDTVLDIMGFTNVQYDNPDQTRVSSATPETVRGMILSKSGEANGRPVSYVFLEADTKGFQAGHWTHLDAARLAKTVNVRMLESGLAYLTLYTSTPYEHREVLREITKGVRESGKGVWEVDKTNDYVLESQADLAPGPDGQLILPKLFRRSTDYLKAVAKGFSGGLKDWLLKNTDGTRPENDRLLINESTEVSLSDVILQENRHVIFQPDLLDVTFVEKV